jgi:DNA repair exonuclease SbcCD ATPase subunit
MDTHTNDQLLMCEKQDLVKYITELKKEKERFRHLHSQVSCENEELNKQLEEGIKEANYECERRDKIISNHIREHEFQMECRKKENKAFEELQEKLSIAKLAIIHENKRAERNACASLKMKLKCGELLIEATEEIRKGLKKIEELNEKITGLTMEKDEEEKWMKAFEKLKEERDDLKIKVQNVYDELEDSLDGGENLDWKDIAQCIDYVPKDQECGKCGQLSSDEKGQGCKECCPSDDE